MLQASEKSKKYHHVDLYSVLKSSAWEIVGELGPRGLSLREVARRSGVSHASPAYHFGTLDGLLSEVAADGYARLLESVNESASETRCQLLACALGYVRFALAYPNHFRLMLGDACPASASGRLVENRDRAMERLRSAVREAWIDRHGYAPDAELLDERTVLGWSAAHGYACIAVEYARNGLELPSPDSMFLPLVNAMTDVTASSVAL